MRECCAASGITVCPKCSSWTACARSTPSSSCRTSSTCSVARYAAATCLQLDIPMLCHIKSPARSLEMRADGISQVDLVLHLLRGAPPAKGNPSLPARDDWVAGVCDSTLVQVSVQRLPSLDYFARQYRSYTAPDYLRHPSSQCGRQARECAVGGEGEEACSSTISFAGSRAVRAFNLSCGWAPEMRFDRILSSRPIRELQVRVPLRPSGWLLRSVRCTHRSKARTELGAAVCSALSPNFA